MVFIFQTSVSLPEKQNERGQQSFPILEQLMPDLQKRVVSNQAVSPTVKRIISESKKFSDVTEKLRKLEPSEKIEFSMLLAEVATRKLGETRAREVLTPFFQQLGISKLIMDLIMKMVSDGINKGKSTESIMAAATQNLQVQQFLQDSDQKFKQDQEKQLKETIEEKAPKSEGIEHQP